MAKDFIGYEVLADRALRSVVREALKHAEKGGLVGQHHFYITFKTHDPGVEIPDFLSERYPDEITIVLQNQFWGLKVGEDGFEVSLTFQKLPATLVVPYAALTAFVDPSVQFGLQFRNSSAPAKPASASQAPSEAAQGPAAASEPAAPTTLPTTPRSEKPAGDSAPAQVVSLDKFRKK
jgi:hypothetical protein